MRRARRRIAAALAALAAGCAGPASSPPVFVGSDACRSCHQQESALWTSSDHAKAMQVATPETVQGDFANVVVARKSGEARFERGGDAFFVHTGDARGRPGDFPVRYVFGFRPLEQYLLDVGNGRLQAFDLAWDSRLPAEGGQRWIDLAAGQSAQDRPLLHWSGPAMNWNHMCADCHSTGLRKGYDAAQDRFETRWSEIDVGCEACHGPASRHLEWARDRDGSDPLAGFEATLSTGAGAWTLDEGQTIARRTAASNAKAQVDRCGRCHSRRSAVHDDDSPATVLADTHRVSLLDEELYEADGQIRGEVYEYGSFLQSAMYARGVGCSDCHDPHSGRLRAEGNAVCASCHQPSVYDSAAHRGHAQGGEGTRCVSCHMPERTFMGVDTRRDHGFRVPRPDLAAKIQSPNACNDCHTDRTADWAASRIAEWHGPRRERGFEWAEAIFAGRRGRPGAGPSLLTAIAAPRTPPIVRATLVTLLARYPESVTSRVVREQLRDENPLVRRAALSLLDVLPVPERRALGGPMLRDPVRTVRLEAVEKLASARDGTDTASADFDAALAEYRAAEARDADRADSWFRLGSLETDLENLEAAERSYRRALAVQPSFVPALLNLADLYRGQEREAETEKLLRDAIAADPSSADAHHALGLSLVRQRDLPAALESLRRAAELSPADPRFAAALRLAGERAGAGAGR